jgi:hypothetical protein
MLPMVLLTNNTHSASSIVAWESWRSGRSLTEQ